MLFSSAEVRDKAMQSLLFAMNHRGMEELNEWSGKIIGTAIRVHSALDPRLLESAHEACLRHELGKAGLEVKSQVSLPI